MIDDGRKSASETFMFCGFNNEEKNQIYSKEYDVYFSLFFFLRLIIFTSPSNDVRKEQTNEGRKRLHACLLRIHL